MSVNKTHTVASTSQVKPQKIIAVMGGTGLQGGGLIEAILDDPNKEFIARCVTRNANSDKAKRLLGRGVQIVEADAGDLYSLERAFNGCYGAYCVTNYWEHFNPELEYQQAANMAQAAKQANLKHVIWSTLEDTRILCPLSDNRMPTLQKKYKVPHFDAKGAANIEFVKAGVPTTFLHTSFYWENFSTLTVPVENPDGTCTIALPIGNKPMSGISVHDIGRCALGCFQRPEATINRDIGIAGDHLTGKEMATGLSVCTGKTVKYVPMDPSEYRKQGFPGADDMGNMFQYYRDFSEEFIALRDLNQTRILYPGTKNWAAFCHDNKGLIQPKPTVATQDKSQVKLK